MIQKSKTTEIHAENSRMLFRAMTRIEQLNLDVIEVDYAAKKIHISKPNESMKVHLFKNLETLNNTTRSIIEGFTVYWNNDPIVKENKYGNA